MYMWENVMTKSELKLTSVKVYKPLYHKFKVQAMDEEFTLQKLVNRAMDLYMQDTTFREQIFEHTNLALSGSMNLWEKI